MGAYGFTHYQPGVDLEDARSTASSNDAYEYGHDAYTGTMSQKGQAVRWPGAALDREAADDLAERLLADWRSDTRWARIVHDKWGPVLAIPVKTSTREITVTKIAGTMATKHDDVVAQARHQRKIRRGEKPTMTSGVYSHEFGRDGRTFTNGSGFLVVAKGPKTYAEQTEPDGWLFVGTAAS